ncbi:MAG: Superfamily I DNA and RNA helicase and helicase subunit, partial [Actinomyces urogenitalis DORA_12]
EAAAPTHEAAPHEDAMQEDRAGQAQERTDQPVPGGEDGVPGPAQRPLSELSAPTSHAHPSGRPGEAVLEEALARWREELVDLGGVASLDDITLLEGVVDLTAAHPSGLAQLYAGRPTHLSSLVRERSALGVARQSLREVAGRTDLLARQFGVAPVYLALGVASWSEAVPTTDADDPGLAEQAEPLDVAEPAESAGDQGEQAQAAAAGLTRTINAPVLLRPVRLASTGGDAALTLGPSIEVNPVVTRALRSAGCRTDVDAVARASLSELGFTPRAALTRLGSLGRQFLPDFEIHERLVVGAFVHPGQALVEDFDATIERARASALVAALAGDPDAQAALALPLEQADGVDRDPALERGVGDLDVAQLDAVEAVSTGASLLLDAPPGSDVVDTLAAVLADAAASGRTVLHVPATGADGHAVAQALREQGLGDLVVDLTEDAGWRLHAAQSIKNSLGVEPPVLDVTGILGLRERLGEVRERLTSSLEALHVPRQPWGVSAYEALQHLAEFTTGRSRSRTGARVEWGMLERLDEEGLDQARTLLHRAHALELLTPSTASSAWNGVTVAD